MKILSTGASEVVNVFTLYLLTIPKFKECLYLFLISTLKEEAITSPQQITPLP